MGFHIIASVGLAVLCFCFYNCEAKVYNVVQLKVFFVFLVLVFNCIVSYSCLLWKATYFMAWSHCMDNSMQFASIKSRSEQREVESLIAELGEFLLGHRRSLKLIPHSIICSYRFRERTFLDIGV